MVGDRKSTAHGIKAKRIAVAKKSAAKPHNAPEARAIVTVDRREIRADRRSSTGSSTDRRVHQIPVAIERRVGERRAKVSRRRQIDPTTCERDYTPDEIEFMSAMDDYKRSSGRMFPTCSEVLEVIRSLGYARHIHVECIAPPTIDVSVGTLETPVGL